MMAEAHENSVSVIIPCYNGEEYLAEAIASALDQTHAPDEVLVVDDGSADDSRAIAERFGAPVRLIRQANSGPAEARNNALRQAKSQWVAFLDADDAWKPHKLAAQLAKASEGFDLVYCDAENFGDVRHLPPDRGAYLTMPEGDVFVELAEENFITTSGVLARREMLLRLGGFDGHFTPAEDYATWLAAACETPFGRVHETLLLYRVHAGGISRNVAKLAAATLRVIEMARRLPKAHTVGPGVWRRAAANIYSCAGIGCELAGQSAPARKWFAQALRIEPWRPARWKAWLRSFRRPAPARPSGPEAQTG